MKFSRTLIAVLLALMSSSYLLTGCSSPAPTPEGYVDAGPNAAPAKKGKSAGAETL